MGADLGPPVAAGGGTDSSDAWGHRGVCPVLREEGLGPGQVPWAPMGASLWLLPPVGQRRGSSDTGRKKTGPVSPI